MKTIPNQARIEGRRHRQVRSEEFKAKAVALCTQPGMSKTAVAKAIGVNASLLGLWVRETQHGRGETRADEPLTSGVMSTEATVSFVPMQLPVKSTASDIRIELRHGATSITVSWPGDASAQCAAWMRELLR